MPARSRPWRSGEKEWPGTRLRPRRGHRARAGGCCACIWAGQADHQQRCRSERPALADNPFSVAASGTITATGQGVDAVDGPAGNGWVVVNNGTITSSAGLGVALTGSGTVVNGTTRGAAASITGADAAVKIEQRPGSVTNSGSIAATRTGVDFREGGMIVNNPTGSVHGDLVGVFITGDVGSVTNHGSIAGKERIGVDLAHGGIITNAVGAAISGNVAGVFFAGGEAKLANAGRISATGAAGADMESGGSVTNSTGASDLWRQLRDLRRGWGRRGNEPGHYRGA